MKNLLFLILVPALLSTAYCQTEKTEKIQSLMEVFGTDHRVKGMLDEFINLQIKDSPFSDTVFWENLKSKLLTVLIDSLKPEVIKIYDKYFSEEEINAMYEFYSSDLGKMTLKKSDMISHELMKISHSYIVNMINDDLKAEEARMKNEIENRLSNEYSGCEKFKIGKFKYEYNDSLVYYFDRTANKQIETFGDGRTVYKVNWLNDCKYELIIESTNNPYMNSQIGVKMTVNIYEVLPNGYKYVAKIGNSEKILEGELTQIE